MNLVNAIAILIVIFPCPLEVKIGWYKLDKHDFLISLRSNQAKHTDQHLDFEFMVSSNLELTIVLNFKASRYLDLMRGNIKY